MEMVLASAGGAIATNYVRGLAGRHGPPLGFYHVPGPFFSHDHQTAYLGVMGRTSTVPVDGCPMTPTPRTQLGSQIGMKGVRITPHLVRARLPRTGREWQDPQRSLAGEAARFQGADVRGGCDRIQVSGSFRRPRLQRAISAKEAAWLVLAACPVQIGCPCGLYATTNRRVSAGTLIISRGVPC